MVAKMLLLPRAGLCRTFTILRGCGGPFLVMICFFELWCEVTTMLAPLRGEVECYDTLLWQVADGNCAVLLSKRRVLSQKRLHANTGRADRGHDPKASSTPPLLLNTGTLAYLWFVG